jgi:5-methylcytosine-specific restriction endonuclease McrA
VNTCLTLGCGLPTSSPHPKARYCAECKRAARRETARAYSERFRQTPEGKAYAHAYNRSEQGKAVFAAYRKTDGRVESLQRYNCSDKRRATSHRYTTSEKGQACSHKMHTLRRARALGAEGQGFASLEQKVAAFELWGGCCAYCARDLARPHWDHIRPLTRGGSNHIDNFALTCKPCNSSKNAKLLSEWRGGVFAEVIPALAALIAQEVSSGDDTSGCTPAVAPGRARWGW